MLRPVVFVVRLTRGLGLSPVLEKAIGPGPAAYVDGQPITAAEIDVEAGPALMDLCCRAATLREAALARVIDRRLLQHEVARQRMTVSGLLLTELYGGEGTQARIGETRTTVSDSERKPSLAPTFAARLARYVALLRRSQDVRICGITRPAP